MNESLIIIILFIKNRTVKYYEIWDEENMDKPRIEYIDVAKGIGIILIILGHLNYLSNPFFVISNSIKIVIFYIISGFLISIKGTINIKKTLRSLSFPYLIFSSIAIMFDLIYAVLGHDSILSVFLNDILLTIICRGISTLWFLPSLLFSELLLYFTYKRKILNKVFIIILPLILIATNMLIKIDDSGIVNSIIITILKTITAFWFLLIGYIVLPYFINSNRNSIICLIIGFISLFLAYFNKGVDFNVFNLGNYPVIFFFSGTFLSLSIIIGMKKICNTFTPHVLKWCGEHSLFLMVTHLPLPIALIINIIFSKIYHFNTVNMYYYIEWIIKLIILLIIEYFILRVWRVITKDKKINSIIRF